MAYKRWTESIVLDWQLVDTMLVEFPHRWLRASRTTSTHTIDVMYTARAILLLVALSQEQDIEIHEIDPNEWQPAMLSGYPGTPKEAAIAIAESEVSYPTEHEADAICMGLWWIKKEAL